LIYQTVIFSACIHLYPFYFSDLKASAVSDVVVYELFKYLFCLYIQHTAEVFSQAIFCHTEVIKRVPNKLCIYTFPREK